MGSCKLIIMLLIRREKFIRVNLSCKELLYSGDMHSESPDSKLETNICEINFSFSHNNLCSEGEGDCQQDRDCTGPKLVKRDYIHTKPILSQENF